MRSPATTVPTPLPRALFAEFLGTLLLVFLTLGTAVYSQDGGITPARMTELSLAACAAVICLVYIFGPTSGGVFNPAVGLALTLAGQLPPARAASYAVAQIAGAAAGAACVRALAPALFLKIGGGINYVQAGATVEEAFGAEAGAVFALALTALASSRTPHLAPIAAGIATMIGHMLALPASAASLNPARTIGVAAVAGDWRDLWLFIVAPCLGAAGAAFVHVHVLTPPVPACRAP